MINCNVFLKSLKDNITGELSYDIKQLADEHMNACSNCKKIYDEQLKTYGLLRRTASNNPVEFSSSRTEIFNRINKSRYSKKPLNKANFFFRRNSLKYAVSGIALILFIYSSPYIYSNLKASNPINASSDVSCDVPQNINKTKALSVSIETDVDNYSRYMSSVRGITLIPKLEGKTDKNLQYHWSIDSDTEMFDTPNGPQKEIINSGESVLFTVIALINYVKPNTLAKSINVTLTVEEKGSNNVLKKTGLIIEDYSGTYKVKK